MKHHLERAKHVYESRGLEELARSAFTYVPIEIDNFLFQRRYGTGTHVMDEDWDTLILLDACRYDIFEDAIEMEGALEYRISLGSTSEEFLSRNFSAGTFHDTVYVNANAYLPYLGLDEDETFHDVIDLYEHWDPDLEIAHPQMVTDEGKKAHERYPNKRVIVHYMQPHIPFLGEYGREVQKRVDRRSVWKQFRAGEFPVSVEEAWDAYVDNLDFVLDYVQDLLSDINGKAVISADHGNLVGERHGPVPTKKMYGHPWGVYTPELVKVPWFMPEFEERRNTVSEPPKSVSGQSDEKINERLKKLGYQA
jgi:hypothetical protein